MRRLINCLTILLLLGLSILPCLSQTDQRQIEDVAKMSEAEMRTELPRLKAHQAQLYQVLKTGNYNEIYEEYGKGDELKDYIIVKDAQSRYEHISNRIKIIERRLNAIDSQQAQQELQSQQNADFQEAVNRHLEESEPRYRQYHSDVDYNISKAVNGNEAVKSTRLKNATGYEPTYSYREERRQNQRPANRDISGKFNKRNASRPNDADYSYSDKKQPENNDASYDNIEHILRVVPSIQQETSSNKQTANPVSSKIYYKDDRTYLLAVVNTAPTPHYYQGSRFYSIGGGWDFSDIPDIWKEEGEKNVKNHLLGRYKNWTKKTISSSSKVGAELMKLYDDILTAISIRDTEKSIIERTLEAAKKSILTGDRRYVENINGSNLKDVYNLSGNANVPQVPLNKKESVGWVQRCLLKKTSPK